MDMKLKKRRILTDLITKKYCKMFVVLNIFVYLCIQ